MVERLYCVYFVLDFRRYPYGLFSSVLWLGWNSWRSSEASDEYVFDRDYACSWTAVEIARWGNSMSTSTFDCDVDWTDSSDRGYDVEKNSWRLRMRMEVQAEVEGYRRYVEDENH